MTISIWEFNLATSIVRKEIVPLGDKLRPGCIVSRLGEPDKDIRVPLLLGPAARIQQETRALSIEIGHTIDFFVINDTDKALWDGEALSIFPADFLRM